MMFTWLLNSSGLWFHLEEKREFFFFFEIFTYEPNVIVGPFKNRVPTEDMTQYFLVGANLIKTSV